MTRLGLGLAIAIAMVVATTPKIASADDAVVETEARGIYLEAPLTDVALRDHDASPLPTMQQSLWLSTNLYEGVHFALGKVVDPLDRTAWWKGLLGRLLVGGADLLLFQLPFGAGWQHEEWHRAVLKNRGVESYNGVYDFELFRSTIAVSHVADQGLIDLKARHPAEFVRMGTAGIEANYELATNLEKVNVFYNPRTYPSIAVAILNLTNIFYMVTCADPDSDARIARTDASETTIPERDFTGFDCVGWTYDLHRPNEPYAARGVHPSGVGIRRYRRFADLTPNERDYLETQRSLSVLNLIDPAMFGFPAFHLFGGRVRTTGHVRHMPTSFGNTINLDVLLHTSQLNVFASLQSYFNRDHYFPGVALEVQRFKLPFLNLADRPTWLTARAGLWFQPRDQSFSTATIQPGGLLAMRLGYEVTNAFSPYIEVEGKTAGWVAGNVALGESLAFRTGLTLWAR